MLTGNGTTRLGESSKGKVPMRRDIEKFGKN